jgi:gluconolactonase
MADRPQSDGTISRPDAPIATVDLTRSEQLAAVGGEWRYHDVAFHSTRFWAADADGQPYGPLQDTWDIEPHAGTADFNDSSWPVVRAEDLAKRRGPGRVSFNWYRLHLKIPARVGTVVTADVAVLLHVRLDDYAEIWVDGELARPFGASGGAVIAGWNATNRVLLSRHAKAGQEISVAIFGINGPISDPPSNYIFVRDAHLEFLPAQPGPAAVVPQEVNVEVERADPAIDHIVPRNAKLIKLAEGFEFTEGPVWRRSDASLLFSDPNANRIYRYSESGELSVFREHSGYEGADIAEYGQPGSNGLTFDRDGHLIINEHGRHRVSRLESDGHLTVLADSYQGKRLNSPNDLVVKSDGAVYFTDPPFGLPKFFGDPRKELPWSGVYRIKDGHIALLAKDFTGPNGLAFSPDEKYFYVDNWDADHKLINRYPVTADGLLGKGTTFVDLTALIPGEEALDGMKVDTEGNLYVSAPGGVWIFDASGKHLGTIKAPHAVHNFAWGGHDGKTLYLAARSTLYRIELLIPGIRP